MAVRKVLRKVALSLLSLLVFALVGELVARAAEPGPFSLFDRNPYLRDAERHHVHRPGFEGRWDGTWYSINSIGLRGPELPIPTLEHELRVVCVGDSCTFGKGVREEESWPRQLETLLSEVIPPPVRPVVANLGVNGYSGREYLAALQRVGFALAPDIIVVGYNLNDFPNVIRAVDEEVYRKRGLRTLLPSWLRDGLNRLALYRYLRQTYYDWNRERDWRRAEELARAAVPGEEDPAVWESQRANLERLAAEARDHDAKVAVFLFPYESQVYLETYDSGPIDRLRALCAELRIPFVSVADDFRTAARESDPPPALFLRGDRYHPTALGYSIVARSVLDVLHREGWLQAP